MRSLGTQIPSKALRHSVSRLIEFNSNPLFNSQAHRERMTYPDILDHASNVISKQVNLRTSFYDRNRITLLHGDKQVL